MHMIGTGHCVGFDIASAIDYGGIKRERLVEAASNRKCTWLGFVPAYAYV